MSGPTPPVVPSVPSSFYTGSYYQNESDQKWNAELATLDTLPNAWAQLLYIIGVMMPTKEQNLEGKMEYQDYLMNQVSDSLLPLLDVVKDQFNLIMNTDPADDSYPGINENYGDYAVQAADEILQLIYTNPNLSGNAQLVDNLTSVISSLFTGTWTASNGNKFEVYLQNVTNVAVNINGTVETVTVPQIEAKEQVNGSSSWKPVDPGAVITNVWSGLNVDTNSYLGDLQIYQGDLTEGTTDMTDFSKTATSVFQFFEGELKQLLSILKDILQDISKGEQQAISNENIS